VVAKERSGLLDTLVTSCAGVQRRLTQYVVGKAAQRSLDTEPDPLMQAYTTSCCGAESWTPFDLITHRAGELSDGAFRSAALLRLGYPFFPECTVCALCNKSAGASLVHGLNCSATKQFGVTNRHTGFQDAMVETIRAMSGGKASVVAHAPVYADHGFVPLISPIPKGSKIIKGDFMVSLAPTWTRADQQLIVDVTVAMITEKNLAQARTTTGVVAANAELRKVNEVLQGVGRAGAQADALRRRALGHVRAQAARSVRLGQRRQV